MNLPKTITATREYWQQGPTDTRPFESVDPHDTAFRYSTAEEQDSMQP